MSNTANSDSSHAPTSTQSLRYANVFIIGAAKSGTTHLCSLLKQHSQIYICDNKEPCFFSLDHEYQKGFDYYASLFSGVTDLHKVLIDASTQYSRCTVFPDVPQRIFDAVPNAKFIYLMRHPIDRAFSHYTHRWLKEAHPNEPFTQTFKEFVQEDPMCVDDSLYKLQIEHYLSYFPKDRFLFLLTEELNSNWDNVIQKIYQHLNIEFESLVNQQSRSSNVSSDFRQDQARNQLNQKLKQNPVVSFVASLLPRSGRDWIYKNILRKTNLYRKELNAFTPPPMKPETRDELRQKYQETVRWVEQVTGKQLNHWYE